MDTDKGFRPRALGEIAIRCHDIGPMVDFYQDVIGLERLSGNRSSDIVFFKISDGFGGHTCVLALFAADAGQSDKTSSPKPHVRTGTESSLHHIALSLPYHEQEAVVAWYEKLGIKYRVEHFGWIGWRGVFTNDPEGNTVELVAYDLSEVSPKAENGLPPTRP